MKRSVASNIIGRDDPNLLSFPIGITGKHQPRDDSGSIPEEIRHRVHVFDVDVGSVVPKELRIRRGAEEFCTSYEVEILVGLLTLHHLTDNFTTPKLQFKNEDLYRLMKWTAGSGKNNVRLEKGLARIHGTQLSFFNTWSNDGGKTFEKTYRTGILDSYEFIKTSQGTGRSWIRWSDNVYADIERGHLKQLNTELFYSLNRPTSQAAFRILDTEFQRGKHVEMDIMLFAARVGISAKTPSKARDQLKPVVADLERLPTFIRSGPTVSRYQKIRKGESQIVFDADTEAISVNTTSDKSGVITKRSEAHELITAFYECWKQRASHRPSNSELRAARQLLSEFSLDELSNAAARVAKATAQGWPDCANFCGSISYWYKTMEKNSLRVKAKQREQQHSQTESDEGRRRRAKSQRREQLITMFEELPSEEQQSIRNVVHQQASQFVRDRIERGHFDDALVRGACLAELDRRLQHNNAAP